MLFSANLAKAESTDTALLPSVSCNTFLENKNSQKSNQENIISTQDDIYISGDCLVPSVTHISIPGTGDSDLFSDQTSVYVVRKGDSIELIAKMFGVSVNTVRWANDLKVGAVLKEGQVLVILPISGIRHTVKQGQTLESIAKLYKADILDIASFNGITKDTKLTVGDELTIPDAEMSNEGGDKPVGNLAESAKKDQNYYEKNPSIKNLSNYFINPVPNGHKTQGLHDKYAIDIGAPIGTPIYASASGTVIFSRKGWNGGYGNLVIMIHPNGTETRYAHLSKIAVSSGEKVAQGDVIGYVGSTGHSTGPHLHLEIRGARNPGTNWSWKHWDY